MNDLFYIKLSLINIKRNSKTYFPYILTCIFTIIMFYNIHSLSINEGINSGIISFLLFQGTIIMMIFSAVFLFYSNSFLFKRRKKEFALYSILGLENKHIKKIMFLETFFILAISLLLGLLSGIILSKFIFLILIKLMKFPVTMKFTLSLNSILTTIIVFSVIFLIILVFNFFQIKSIKIVELLKGNELGEREPKSNFKITIIGIISLGTGYIITLLVKSPVDAVFIFLIAVVLVMIGTYCLFTSGSIVLIKQLKKNKKFYYKINNFISLSSMLYRMKQNAVGLASICILSTAVMLTISTTVSFYLGEEDILKTRFPYDASIYLFSSESDKISLIDDEIKNQSENNNIIVKNKIEFRYVDFLGKKDGNNIILTNINDNDSNVYNISLINVEEYNKLENKSEVLNENEILIFTNGKNFGQNVININNIEFKIKKELDNFILQKKESSPIVNQYYVILKDSNIINNIYKDIYNKDFKNYNYTIKFNLDGDENNIIQFINVLKNNLTSVINDNIYIESMHKSKYEFYSLYGCLFFLGVFLGILFIMATVLIIYYKQISEGYDDKQRYEIMQKIGINKKEIKQSIKSQIMIVFSLPIFAAIVHIAVSFKILVKVMAVLNLVNVNLFLCCVIVTVLCFVISYILVYLITAREYYKIVK